jgi:Predicted transcriptional regulator with C-terminal CBS domains
MLVKALMLPKEQLIVANPNDSLKVALKKIEDNNFLSIPVADGKTFVGAISKEKIFEEYFKGNFDDKESFLESTRVKGIFCGIIPRVDPGDPVERASRVLETFGIPFVAVVDEKDEFHGIVTHYAIFHAFGEIFGINEGRRIAVTTYDVPGQLARLTDIVTKSGGDIISLAVLNPNVKLDVKEIVLRVRVINYELLLGKIKDAGFKVE